MNNAEILNHIIAVLGRSLQQWRFLSVDDHGCRVRFNNTNHCRIWHNEYGWHSDNPWIMARLNGLVRDEQGVML